MTHDRFYYLTDSGASRDGTRGDAVTWLTGLYGPHFDLIGIQDGTEDDYGDMLSADLPFAILGEHIDPTDEDIDVLSDRLDDANTWSEALDIAREVLS